MKNLNILIVEGNTEEENLKFKKLSNQPQSFNFRNNILKYYPDFNNILRRYGSVQIRNVGTIGGNIATASPIGDTLPLLLSLNAKIIIQTKKGNKQILLNNFFIKYRKTKLKKGS